MKYYLELCTPDGGPAFPLGHDAEYDTPMEGRISLLKYQTDGGCGYVVDERGNYVDYNGGRYTGPTDKRIRQAGKLLAAIREAIPDPTLGVINILRSGVWCIQMFHTSNGGHAMMVVHWNPDEGLEDTLKEVVQGWERKPSQEVFDSTLREGRKFGWD